MMIGSFSGTAWLTSYYMHKTMIQSVHVQTWCAKMWSGETRPAQLLTTGMVLYHFVLFTDE